MSFKRSKEILSRLGWQTLKQRQLQQIATIVENKQQLDTYLFERYF